MPLITMFGINAVGKDTIANKFMERNPKTFITSESRLLMHYLGIIDKCGVDDQVARKDYKKLENTSQKRIKTITNGVYKDSLISFSQNSHLTILLSHLVFMLHIDKEEPVFLDEKDPPFPELSNGLIQIKSGIEDVLSRKIKDNETGIRERYHCAKELIKKHQYLCDKKWEKIIASRPINTYTVIDNDNIDKAVSDVERFIVQL